MIGAETRELAEEWAGALKQSINAAKQKALAKILEEESSTFTNEGGPHFEGSLTMGDKTHHFVLEGSVLMWFAEETDLASEKVRSPWLCGCSCDVRQAIKKNIRGFVALRRDMAVTADDASGPGGLVLARGPVGRSIALRAASPSLRDAWVNHLTEALTWLTDQNARVVQRVRMSEKVLSSVVLLMLV